MIAINAIRDTFIYAMRYPYILLAPLVPALLAVFLAPFFTGLALELAKATGVGLAIVTAIVFGIMLVCANAWTWGVIVVAVADIEIYGKIRFDKVLGEAFSWIVHIIFMSLITAIVFVLGGLVPSAIIATVLTSIQFVFVDAISTIMDPTLLLSGLSILGLIVSLFLLAIPVFVLLAMSLALPARVTSTPHPGRAIELAWETASKHILSLLLLNIFVIVIFFLLRLIVEEIPVAGMILTYFLGFYLIPAPLILFYMKANDATPEEYGLRQEYEELPD